MTGFGSPCGACKFLRRKCARGCVFAPYFCHEQGAAHFGAVHKVFGASNVSKLLMHLPVNDRCEAAVTISYEAQARLRDPIYGCVAHIFALQQQVVSLQAQLAFLKAQVSQSCPNGSSTTSSPQEEELYCKFPPYQQDVHGLFQMGIPLVSNPSTNDSAMMHCDNGLMDSNCILSQDFNPQLSHNSISFGTDDDFPNAIRPPYDDMEDLQSVAFAYLHRR